MPKPTPRPWRVDTDIKVKYNEATGERLEDEVSRFIYSETKKPFGAFLAYVNSYGVPDAEANAAHIVKCVNMHGELVSEIQTLLDVIEVGAETPEDLEGLIKYSRDLLAKAKADE